VKHNEGGQQMAGKTVDDLKVLREKLVEQRRREAYRVHGAESPGIEKLVRTHQAIEALDAVIAEGKGEPETNVSGLIG
jgi:hypothetical protein